MSIYIHAYMCIYIYILVMHWYIRSPWRGRRHCHRLQVLRSAVELSPDAGFERYMYLGQVRSLCQIKLLQVMPDHNPDRNKMGVFALACIVCSFCSTWCKQQWGGFS